MPRNVPAPKPAAPPVRAMVDAIPRPAQWRHEVWADLARVAKPDSRFHLRFSECIPDFHGADQATQRLLQTPALAGAHHVFVTPDNSLIELRHQLLLAGVSFVVPSYNLARGFFHFPAHRMSPEQALFAAWLDGLEHFGVPIDLAALADLGPFSWVATGSSAVAVSGVRFGRGHGFFDLEWRIFGELGVVDDHTPIGTVVHDVQVLEQPLLASPDDVSVNWIATPTRTLHVAQPPERPRRIDWARIDAQQVQDIPPLAELQRAQGLSS